MLWLFFTILLADQLSKYWALQNLSQPWSLTPWLRLKLSGNCGVGFSLLSDCSWTNQLLLILLSFLIILFLWYDCQKKNILNRTCQYCLVALSVSALSNSLDRLFWGSVIDFIDLHLQSWHWPTFNLADSCISLSGLWLMITLNRPKVSSAKKTSVMRPKNETSE